MGKPGLYAHAPFYGFCWNPDDNTWLQNAQWDGGSAFLDRPNGFQIYLPGPDRLVIFSATGPAMWLEAGAGLQADFEGAGYITATSSPPVSISGHGGTTDQGHIVAHPKDPNVLLCLREHGGSQVWRSDDYGASWTPDGTHPFTAWANTENRSSGEYTVGTISTCGVIMGIVSNTVGGAVKIWKPND